jgi:hypothetical protein
MDEVSNSVPTPYVEDIRLEAKSTVKLEACDGAAPIDNRTHKTKLACFLISLPTIGRTPNAERRTPNAERRTPNAERQPPLPPGPQLFRFVIDRRRGAAQGHR